MDEMSEQRSKNPAAGLVLGVAAALLALWVTAAPASAPVAWVPHADDARQARIPGPVLGRSVNVGVVSGTIRVRDKGERKFHHLNGNESIPVGSSVDATKGKVRLTSAKKKGGEQAFVYFDGRFKVRQARRRTLTDIKLEGGNFAACTGGARSAAVAPRVLRRLWGRGRGRTRTSGHSGSGTVRGTFWLTVDRCDGTLFKVKRGTVVVRDFTLRRSVVLHAGEKYLARASGVPPAVQRTLIVNKAGTGAGTVTSSPAGINCGATCSAQFADSTSVTLTATANAGSTFSSWTGCDSVNGSQCTLSTTADRTVTATFTAAPVQRTLVVSKAGTGAGTVTSSPAGINCGATCSAQFADSTSVTLTAVASPGSLFSSWAGCDSLNGNQCTVSMTTNRTVRPTFTAVPQRTLTVNKAGFGAGSVTSSPAGINCGATCSAQFADPTSVILTATPNAGSFFDSWTGCGSANANKCTVSMTANRTVTATFQQTFG